MEELKTFENITTPDVRNTYFVIGDGKGYARKLSLSDIHEVVSRIVLNESVPTEIRSHFSQAQNLAVYSWFHYPFNVTAQFLGFISVEYALKIRLKSKGNFKNLIEMAVRQKLISDAGFAIAALRESADKPYVETLVDVMPKLRNRLAHGSDMLHNSSLSSLRICADFINQLFPAERNSD
ncbi:TPA: hypothetical protein ACK3Q6_005420 [Burkholderia cepacia]|uniref:hypothetical protein n=1 Tax=Burkholderia cepacia TaxID=292 RepID=UPI001CF436DA|nr:hypothetical protein [Burkholderia cepacia]MCA8355907.1 hypothetical protein [Burkholderia cepacia]HDR9757512.1 hypothetical protein [Burkholderia cepacia ATCC 25416]HDV6369750.1 hypothetical protein [Burkholderia cepacia]